jgi:hypothetical protein
MEQVIDLVELEEKYGADLANAIKNDLDFAIEQNHDWKLKVIGEGKYVITIAFVYKFSTCIYEVSKRRKKIMDKYILGKFDCEKLIGLMNSFDQAE